MKGQNLLTKMHHIHKAKKVRRKRRKRMFRLILIAPAVFLCFAILSQTWANDSDDKSIDTSYETEIEEHDNGNTEPEEQMAYTEEMSEDEAEYDPIDTESSADSDLSEYDSSIDEEAIEEDHDAPDFENTFLFPDSNTRKLTEEDLQGLDEYTVQLAINEICAREGRIFRKSEWQNYFEGLAWYTPRVEPDEFDNNIDDYLDTVERYNYELLCKYRESM